MSMAPCTRLPPLLFVPPFYRPSVQSRNQETVPPSYHSTLPPATPCHLLPTCRNRVAVPPGAPPKHHRATCHQHAATVSPCYLVRARATTVPPPCHHRATELPGAPPCHHRATMPPGAPPKHYSATMPPGAPPKHYSATVPPAEPPRHHSATVPPGAPPRHRRATVPSGRCRTDKTHRHTSVRPLTLHN